MWTKQAATRLVFVIAAFACTLPQAAQPTTRILIQSSPLAGFQFHEGKLVWDQLKVGDVLMLVREPDNPHDAHAVRVHWNGHMLGMCREPKTMRWRGNSTAATSLKRVSCG